MYNDQLEKLIEMALMDGELTDKERTILSKKAESFGVDIDEFEMVWSAYERNLCMETRNVRVGHGRSGSRISGFI